MKMMKRDSAVLKMVLAMVWAFHCMAPSHAQASAEIPEGVVDTLEYGIEGEDLTVKRDVVKRRQNLSGILSKAGMPYQKIHEAIEKSKGVFDIEKIRIGNPYCIISSRENEERPCYFVYELNPVDYVVFEFEDAVRVYRKSKPVRIRHRTVEGIIESSLWNTFDKLDLDLDFELAIRLSEIFAWSVDFYHFRKGDRFKLIYEEKRVGERLVGIGRILAARVTFRGNHHYGFSFTKGREKEDYFDENGQSLRKAFLKAPLKYVRISSGYSKSRLHPVLNEKRPHLGIDYAAPEGTSVVSVGDGIIEKVDYNETMGNYIQIRHNRTYMTQYLHLSGSAETIRPGIKVCQGDVIGYVGSTGLATGPHLDFRFWEADRAVNFLNQDIPTADPIPTRHQKTYLSRIAALKTDLDRDEIRHYSAEIGKGENG